MRTATFVRRSFAPPRPMRQSQRAPFAVRAVARTFARAAALDRRLVGADAPTRREAATHG